MSPVQVPPRTSTMRLLSERESLTSEADMSEVISITSPPKS